MRHGIYPVSERPDICGRSIRFPVYSGWIGTYPVHHGNADAFLQSAAAARTASAPNRQEARRPFIIGDDFLRRKAHPLEFLNLENTADVVGIIVSVSAFCIGAGGSQQTFFFQTD